ncbi:MAG: MBL fold metallo-hydrolase [Leptolyngbya sp.]|nr:MBL fold metallo-hydrolase [Leptolyngbya sp.]
MRVTWLDNNSWLWEMAHHRILVDPWLVGPLVFGNAPWLFRGERSRPCPPPDRIDLILLSQGLEDHAHVATLRGLDKAIPVVASPNGARVATDLGFQQVTALAHHHTHTHGEIIVTALPGAPIGPTLKENGYVVMTSDRATRLFYEPHGYHPISLRDHGPVDVVITPMVDLTLPLVGPIIRGRASAQELADWLQPQVMLPTANAGETAYRGLLASLLKAQGSVAEVRQQLAAQGHSTTVLEPAVGVAMDLPLATKPTPSVS